MIEIIPMNVLYSAVIALATGAAGMAAVKYGGEGEDAIQKLETGTGTAFEMRPAPTDKGGLPVLRWFKNRSRQKKKKKALRKGYVRWHIVSDAISKEKYVKPEQKEGGNVPELEYEGTTYLFPREQMIPGADDGVWWCMHEEGKAEPIPLREGNPDTMSAHALQEYLNLRVVSKNPGGGLLGGLGDIGPADIMKYGLLAIVGYAVLMEVMGGGLF